MNDVSRLIVQLLTRLNDAHASPIVCSSFMFSIHRQAAYTFDAGPNAVIYALEANVPEILAAVAHFFPCTDGSEEFEVIDAVLSKRCSDFFED
jgi:diphosphomevalonate decarboxylase